MKMRDTILAITLIIKAIAIIFIGLTWITIQLLKVKLFGNNDKFKRTGEGWTYIP